MNLTTICPAENDIKIHTQKGFSKNVSRAAAVCGIFLLIQILVSFFGYPVFQLICENIGADHKAAMPMGVYQLIAYTLMFSIIIAIALMMFRNNPKKPRIDFRPAPRFPLLYVFGTVGLSYAIALISSAVFSELLEEQPLAEIPLPQSVGGIILTFVSVALLPAIFEEWLFRGIILKNLLPYGKWPAIIVSALLFGTLHTDIPKMPGATVFGLCLGILFCCTGRVFLGSVIHFINNAFSVAASYILVFEMEEASIYFGLAVSALIVISVVAVVCYIIGGLERKRIVRRSGEAIGYLVTATQAVKRIIFNPGTIFFLIMLGATLGLQYLI